MMRKAPMPKRRKPMTRNKGLTAKVGLSRSTSMNRTSAPIERSEPMKRTAPMPRAQKPIAHRNKERRPPERASAQRAVCMERDRDACVFEVLTDGAWVRCGRTVSIDGSPLQAAHIFRRGRIGNREAIDHPDVVVAACVEHHQAWDQHRRNGLRFPEDAVVRAREAINQIVLPENIIRDRVYTWRV